MTKLLIGGSPCTHWSIAQKNNRETEANGIGWELFRNYLIAKEKFKPDYFLYENNKSMSKEIKASITKAFSFEPVLINSALVSAQNRQRLYWVGGRNEDGTYSKVDVEQPEDRGILLRDILESNAAFSYVDDNKTKVRTHKKNYLQYDISGKGHGSQDQRAFYCNNKHGCLDTGCRGKSKVLLDDGRIRHTTITEKERLQTLPDNYTSIISEAQAGKAIGNGWTVEVIKHILSHIPNIQHEEIMVLSMYDGMSCGQIALKEMGCNVIKYYATEIDKYAIKTTQHNFPTTIQLGDAFQVREDGWDCWGNEV